LIRTRNPDHLDGKCRHIIRHCPRECTRSRYLIHHALSNIHRDAIMAQRPHLDPATRTSPEKKGSIVGPQYQDPFNEPALVEDLDPL
jgi:hypothetical protein